MKSSKTLVAILVAPLFAVALAFAADAKKDAVPAAKVASCCADAFKAGKTCTHACCIEAAKKGLNCTTCGGTGALAKPAEKK